MAQRKDVTELIATIDRLERLLERSALSELEMEVEGTTMILRTPAALVAIPGTATAAPLAAPATPGPVPPQGAADDPVEERGAHAVTAPLTGVFYRSPSPDAEPYVREGGQVSAGQVIGLIEAMKLFNEIKSDVTGVVRRMNAGDGELVKAKQTLIEVDPA
jgi:acetyl-CoA carboxylase biotin carboxyl carrier protein